MKICILSDSHDNHDLLEAAVAAAVAEGVEAVVHCGDVVSANALKMAGNHHIPTHVIHGNNSGDLFALAKYSSDPSNQCLYYGQDASLTLHGKRIFLVHYPHYAHAMACTGDYDLVCCGHSHKTEISEYKTVKGTSSWCVNPAARSKKESPLYGMPILNVDYAATVMVLKRSLNPGFAGEDNDLFYDKKTMMVFGDAKGTLTKVLQILKQ